MDQRLEVAAQVGDIEKLYSVIKENKNALEEVDQVPFINTPLHIAASAGHTLFSMEIMRLKPSYAKKLNQDGYSPIHMALQNGQTQLVLRLLDMDGNLVRVQGKEGKTVLHMAAEYGMVDLLAEFLAVCPKSIQDLNIHKETALHIAVKNDRLEAFRVLLGWLKHVDKDMVLKWADHEGNTILHVAVSRNNIEIVSLLIGRVNINAINSEGLTALDILENQRQFNDEKLRLTLLRGGALRGSSLPRVSTLAESMTKMSWREKFVVFDHRQKLYMSNDDRNAVLVIAILIATSNYEVVIDKIYSADAYGLLAKVISIVNSIAFLASMVEIYLLLPQGYGILQPVLPLIILNVLLMYGLDALVPTILLCAFYCFKWPVVLHKFSPIFMHKKSMEIKRSILKHCSSFHRNIELHN